MTFSSIVAIIGGIVTAGCAIVGVVAGIRARRAREAREEDMRRVQHEATLLELKEKLAMRRNRRNAETYPTYPVNNNEVHHYYHEIPQFMSNYISNNQYMNPGYTSSGYSYGNSYKDTVYPGERAIGNMSKMQLLQRMFPQQQTLYQPNYYPQSNYAYAI